MSDSWPAPPQPNDASDSLAGQALEVERALKALEAVDSFRAEAAALRAELQAIRASGALAARGSRRRSALRRGSADLPEGAWRLVAECAVIVGVAVVAWAVHMGRVGILLTLGGTWLVVAAFEAIASRTPKATWAPPPPAAGIPAPVVQAIAPAPPAAPSSPEALPEPATGWPSRLEPVEALQSVSPESETEPDPEIEPEPEPIGVIADVEPDGGPSVGAFAAMEEESELRGREDARRRRGWWALFRRRERPAPEPILLEPEVLVEQAEPVQLREAVPEVEPDGGPSIGAWAALEEAAELLAKKDAIRSRRRWRLFGKRQESAPPEPPVHEPEALVQEPEPEPEPIELTAAETGAEPDVGPLVGAYAVLEETADLRAASDARRPRRRWRLFRRQSDDALETPLPEPEAFVESTEPVKLLHPEIEAVAAREPVLHLGEDVPADTALEKVEPQPDETASHQSRWWQLVQEREEALAAEASELESEALASEPEPEPTESTEPEPVEAEPHDEEAASHQERWWQLQRDREEASASEASPSQSEDHAEDLAAAPPTLPPAAPEAEIGWPVRLGVLGPEVEAESELDSEPKALDGDDGDGRSHRSWPLFRSEEGPVEPEQEGLVDEPELEPEPLELDEPKPQPEPLYAFVEVEPDGGPTVGVAALLEEVATFREQPPDGSPSRRRFSRLRFRRRASV